MTQQKRQSREFCFQYFFHIQLPVFEELKAALSERQDKKAIISSINEFKESTNVLLNDEQNQFVTEQVLGTLTNYTKIEELITKYLKNWKLERISKVDHTNLLLAVHELCFAKNSPPKVVINEAIEISKKFGAKESSSFINGVLDNIAKNEL